MTFTTSNDIGESHVFSDVKFDHVTSRDTMLLGIGPMNRVSGL